MPHPTPHELRNQRHARLREGAKTLVKELESAQIKATPTPEGEVEIPLASFGQEQRVVVIPAATPETITNVKMHVANQVAQAAETGDIIIPAGVDAWIPSGTSTSVTAATNHKVWRLWNAAVRHRCHRTGGWIDDDPWYSWNTNSSVTTGSNTLIWESWVEDGIRKQAVRLEREVRQRKLTEAQLAEQRARREREEIERKARVAEIELAKQKAEKLLLSALDNKQKEELKTKGYFHCKSQKGFVYRIYKGTHGNVKRLDDRGREVEKLCVQPDNVPDFDAMLAQKLHIEYNEDDFRRTANITRLLN